MHKFCACLSHPLFPTAHRGLKNLELGSKAVGAVTELFPLKSFHCTVGSQVPDSLHVCLSLRLYFEDKLYLLINFCNKIVDIKK